MPARRDNKPAHRSKTILAMVIAIMYALNEQFILAINSSNEFNFSAVNWGMLSTAVLAVILRFFNDKPIKL